MWHVTRDMWHMTHLGGWTFSQNFSSLALTVCDLGYYEDLEEKDELLNELITRLFVGQPRLHRVCQKWSLLRQNKSKNIWQVSNILDLQHIHMLCVGHLYRGIEYIHVNMLKIQNVWNLSDGQSCPASLSSLQSPARTLLSVIAEPLEWPHCFKCS